MYLVLNLNHSSIITVFPLIPWPPTMISKTVVKESELLMQSILDNSGGIVRNCSNLHYSNIIR